MTIQSKVINDEIPTNYGPGHDVLEGGGGDEVLSTKRGDDKLIGGGGEDVLEAGLDDDDVRSADGRVGRGGLRAGRGRRERRLVRRREELRDRERGRSSTGPRAARASRGA